MDVDMVALLTDYNLLTTAYETSLAVMSKMQQTNILDYLR
jgi:flagellin-like hook-associated protein FlgL